MPKKSTAQPRPKVKVQPRGIGPVAEPNENDVLCGRGGRINSHEGNVQFRSIVAQRKKAYLAPTTKKLEKAHIAAKLVDDIRAMDPPGRFLSQDNKDGMWYDIGDAKAIKKVGQALREDAPEIREEFEDDGDSSGDEQYPNIVTPPAVAQQRPSRVVSGRGHARPSVVGRTKTDYTIEEDIPAFHARETSQQQSSSSSSQHQPQQRFDLPPGMQNIPTKLLNHGKKVVNRGLDALDLNSSAPKYAFGMPYTSPHSSTSTNVSSISGLSADEHRLLNSGSSGSGAPAGKSSGSSEEAVTARPTLLKQAVSLGSAEMAIRNSLRSSAIDAEMAENEVRSSQISAAAPFDSHQFDRRRSSNHKMDMERNNSMLSQQSDVDMLRNSILRSSQHMDIVDVRNSLRSSQIDVENLMRNNSMRSSQVDPGILFHDFSRSSDIMDLRDSMRMSAMYDPRSSTASDLSFLDVSSGLLDSGGMEALLGEPQQQQRKDIEEGNNIMGPMRSASWDSNDSWGSHDGPAPLGTEEEPVLDFASGNTPDLLHLEEHDELPSMGPLRSRNQSSASAMSLGTYKSEVSSGLSSTVSELSQEMNTLGLREPKADA